MATEEKAGDVEVNIKRKKDERGSEFQVKLRVNILEPLQRLMKSKGFWASVGAVATAAGGGWVSGRYEPLEDRLSKACEEGVVLEGTKKLGDLEIEEKDGKIVIKNPKVQGKEYLVLCFEGPNYQKAVTAEESDDL